MKLLSNRAVFTESFVTRVYSPLIEPGRSLYEAGWCRAVLDGSRATVRAVVLLPRRHQAAEPMSTVLG
jgi:hypothetical protein